MMLSRLKQFALVALLAFAAGLFGGVAPALAGTGAISVLADGHALVTDAPPLVENGRVLVPVRPLAESLGARVSWDEKARSVLIEAEGKAVKLFIGSSSVLC
ncbi:MAG: copper amine oxidase N-terminal domain-containing protein, partial [Clostridia bacterium]|nr:copper amine oxidase N-terminal domain-containing protein [Clostridia bacterium]